jgi:uncharacterized protein (DUF1015 family)
MSKNINLRFGCVDCMYFSNQNSDVKKHLLTKKHLKKTITTLIDPNWKHQCKGCNKKYNSQSALWYHNKKCKVLAKPIARTEVDILQEQVTEMKNITNTCNK